MEGEVFHTWRMPYTPGNYGYLTERGTLVYNGKVPDPSGSYISRGSGRAVSSSKPIGRGTFCGKYAIPATIMAAFCCATAT